MLFALAALVACGVNENNFPDKYAKAYCGLAVECGSAYYDDSDECQDVRKVALDCQAEACTYNDDAASTCFSETKGADCDAYDDGTISSSCGAVYTDCDSARLSDCVSR